MDSLDCPNCGNTHGDSCNCVSPKKDIPMSPKEAVAHLRHIASLCSFKTNLWTVADLLDAIIDERDALQEILQNTELSMNASNVPSYQRLLDARIRLSKIK